MCCVSRCFSLLERGPRGQASSQSPFCLSPWSRAPRAGLPLTLTSCRGWTFCARPAPVTAHRGGVCTHPQQPAGGVAADRGAGRPVELPSHTFPRVLGGWVVGGASAPAALPGVMKRLPGTHGAALVSRSHAVPDQLCHSGSSWKLSRQSLGFQDSDLLRCWGRLGLLVTWGGSNHYFSASWELLGQDLVRHLQLHRPQQL